MAKLEAICKVVRETWTILYAKILLAGKLPFFCAVATKSHFTKCTTHEM